MRFSPCRQIHCAAWGKYFVFPSQVPWELRSNFSPYHRSGREIKRKVQRPPWEVFFDHHCFCRPRTVMHCPYGTGWTRWGCIQVRWVRHGHFEYVNGLLPQISLQKIGSDIFKTGSDVSFLPSPEEILTTTSKLDQVVFSLSQLGLFKKVPIKFSRVSNSKSKTYHKSFPLKGTFHSLCFQPQQLAFSWPLFISLTIHLLSLNKGLRSKCFTVVTWPIPTHTESSCFIYCFVVITHLFLLTKAQTSCQPPL